MAIFQPWWLGALGLNVSFTNILVLGGVKGLFEASSCKMSF